MIATFRFTKRRPGRPTINLNSILPCQRNSAKMLSGSFPSEKSSEGRNFSNQTPDQMKTKLILLLAASIAALSALAEDATQPKPTPAQEFQFQLKRARDGSVIDAISVADALSEGKGVQKNETLAFQWMQRAAAAGDSMAEDCLSDYYQRGVGVTVNPAEAFKLAIKSAYAGCSGGQIHIGRLYSDGFFVDVNLTEAYAWYTIGSKTQKKFLKERDEIQGKMKPEQIAAAQQRYQELLRLVNPNAVEVEDEPGSISEKKTAAQQAAERKAPVARTYSATAYDESRARISGQLPPLDQWLSEGYSRGIPVKPDGKIPGLFESTAPSLAPMQAQELINQQGREAERAEKAALEQANTPRNYNAGTQGLEETNELLRQQLKAMKYAQAEAEIQAAKMLREQAAQAAAAAHRDYVNEGNRRWAETQAANAAAAAQSAEVARQQQRDMQRIQDAQRGK